jgi:hypothetical protein
MTLDFVGGWTWIEMTHGKRMHHVSMYNTLHANAARYGRKEAVDFFKHFFHCTFFSRATVGNEVIVFIFYVDGG